MTGLGGIITAILAGAILRGTPTAFAVIGETLAERAGVMNLGLEGVMLVGAMASVAAQVGTGNPWLAVLAGGLAGAALASVHAFMSIVLNGNQIVSGVALSILGTGISGFLGRPYVGVRFEGIRAWSVPVLKDIPVVGQIFFQQDPLAYAAVFTALACWVLLYRTRFGIRLRAVGEDPAAAFAQAVPVRGTRAAAVMMGGFLAGVGGAHLALAYTHLWAEQMTAGQGWIAVGLVIVAGWRPLGALLAAYLFGALTVLHPQLQAAGVEVSPYLVALLPYVFAVVALAFATSRYSRRGGGLPAALGKKFSIETI